ncbi:arsenate reductase [Hydrogenovibrio sp. JE_KL2]|uniref:arsenate reductase n=1 Tax=Hydrogenovibrio sp. JE_KL2 TaxID=2651188 RepID=UPI00128E28DA|nr:arsenate reductase [Hydrogenovibrio sp. JE_KL2]MPQ76078.1 arsenate reductase [Hydrogenovibrio sp. JE_KL2]
MKMYGIPNCDTVRKARKFLESHDIDYEFHDFKKQGLSLDTIETWLKTVPLDHLVNKRSTSWKQLSDEQKAALTSGNDLSVLTEMPTLIKRPVLESNKSLLIGFSQAEYEEHLN